MHDCHVWPGHVSNAGYGLAYNPETKKTISAHRLAFKQANGYLPTVVMHLCDNPLCVNPDHLKAGSQKENIQDCISKNRKYSVQKLSLEDCLVIKTSNKSSRELGKQFNVNQKTICNIKNGKYNYQDITGKGGSCGS